MENYLGFEDFEKAVQNAEIRKVADDGSIIMDGRRYDNKALLNYAGQYVRAFVDLEGADAIEGQRKIYMKMPMTPELRKKLKMVKMRKVADWLHKHALWAFYSGITITLLTVACSGNVG